MPGASVAEAGILPGVEGSDPSHPFAEETRMKKTTFFAAALTAVLACQTTFAQEKDNAARRQPDNQPVAPASGVQSNNPAAQRDQPMDQMWTREAAMGGMFEVQLSQLAVQKATSPEIKQFAQKLIDDHTKANQQLMQVAQSKKIDLPSQLDDMHKEKLAKFQKKEGQNFDKCYINHVTAEHVHDILSYRDASQDLRDPELKQFASQQLPTLQQHYQHAARLANWSANDARPAGASEHGAPGDTARPGSTDIPRSTTPGSSGSGTTGSGAGSSGTGTSGGATGTPGTGSGTNGQNVGTTPNPGTNR